MVRCICFDWGGTLMSEEGPQDRAMALWSRVEAIPGAHAVLAALGARKDQAVFWQVVQATTGVALHETAMVGDSLEQDVLGPARFGVRTVWFNAAGKRPSPTPPVDQVQSLSALLPYFGA